MKVKDLIKKLKQVNQEFDVLLAQDEEWEEFFDDISVSIEGRIVGNKELPDRVIVYGVTKSE